MSVITNADLISMQARLAKGKSESYRQENAVEELKESELHDQIKAELNSRGWFFVHSRTDRPTTTRLGVPDFIIACPGAKTFWCECKTKGRKPTTEQLGIGAWLKREGHHFAIVYSLQEFLDELKKV